MTDNSTFESSRDQGKLLSENIMMQLMGNSKEGEMSLDPFARAIVEGGDFFLALSNEIAEEEDDEVKGEGEKTDADHNETNSTATTTATSTAEKDVVENISVDGDNDVDDDEKIRNKNDAAAPTDASSAKTDRETAEEVFERQLAIAKKKSMEHQERDFKRAKMKPNLFVVAADTKHNDVKSNVTRKDTSMMKEEVSNKVSLLRGQAHTTFHGRRRG